MCQIGPKAFPHAGSRSTMPYRFKLDEKVRDGFIRIAHEQIERAQAELAGPSNIQSAVHETRKCLKRVRALLRLVRPGLNAKIFKRENTAIRDIAALLSEARDNHVLLETIAKLEARKADAPLMNLKRFAVAGCSAHGVVEDPGRTAAALAGLRSVEERLEKISIKPASFTTLRGGYERTYAHARRAIAGAYKQNASEAFHELRKHIQIHWRHTQLLSRAWPEIMEAHAAAARELSQILGDDHDLAVLEEFLARAPKGEIGKMEARLVRKAIRERQGELRELAIPRLERLFAERPAEMGRRIERQWKAAKRFCQDKPTNAVTAKRESIVSQVPAATEAQSEPRPGRAA